jgi:hypothetical protein
VEFSKLGDGADDPVPDGGGLAGEGEPDGH